MKIEDLDIPLLVEHVRKIAEAEPNTQSACQYFHETTRQPRCIVGHAMALQGIELSDFSERAGRRRNNERVTKMLNGVPGSWRNSEDIHWLGEVQRSQDSMYTWSAAVATADRSTDDRD